MLLCSVGDPAFGVPPGLVSPSGRNLGFTDWMRSVLWSKKLISFTFFWLQVALSGISYLIRIEWGMFTSKEWAISVLSIPLWKTDIHDCMDYAIVVKPNWILCKWNCRLMSWLLYHDRLLSFQTIVFSRGVHCAEMLAIHQPHHLYHLHLYPHLLVPFQICSIFFSLMDLQSFTPLSP